MPEPLVLGGITSGSLLGCLKGLGVLSALGRQDDSSTAGSWSPEGFVLHSRHDLESLLAFFLERWEPAPVVSPWNGGSGFYGRTMSIDAIHDSDDPRLARMKAAIVTARDVLQGMGLTKKPDGNAEKRALVMALRSTMPDDALEWLDAAIVMAGENLQFPDLLGSGGNDGNFDVADNYAQCVVEVLGLTGAGDPAAALRVALGGGSLQLRKMSLAHFFRDASPVNSPAGEADALANPWDLVLAVTGTLVLSAGATRRMGSGSGSALVAPFTLRASGAGYGSAVPSEKGRAEIWMPTWPRPARLSEVRMMLREGRIQVRGRDAVTGLDAARAVGELGIARGLASFERFAILERAGQSNLSLSAGRIDVRVNPAAEALATLDPWLGRIISSGAGDAPARQRIATRALEQAAFALATDGSARRAVELLAAVGEVEVACAVSGIERIRPLQRAAAGPWLRLLGDADAETRLAITFASLADPAGPGVDCDARTLRGALVGTSAAYGPVDGWSAPREAPILRQLAAAHERRTIAGLGGFAYGVHARPDDLARLAASRIDPHRLRALVRGLVVLDWQSVREPSSGRVPTALDPVLAHLLLAFHDPRYGHDMRVVVRPDWVTRLVAGRVREVLFDVHLHLGLAGLTPVATIGDLLAGVAATSGEHLAAALLAQVSPAAMHDLIRSITTYHHQENHLVP